MTTRLTPPTSGPLLVNLSGGIDSVYATWRLLSAGHRLLIHHCVMRNPEGRADVEADAVDVVLSWLRRSGLRGFRHVRSGYDHGTLGRMVYDIEVIGFFTGVVLRDPANRQVRTVVVSANSGDATVRDPSTPRVVRRRQIAEATAGRRLSWWVPFAHVSKSEMIDALPGPLLSAAWFCRRPQGVRPCGRCRTCREVQSNPRAGRLQSHTTQEGKHERRPEDRPAD